MSADKKTNWGSPRDWGTAIGIMIAAIGLLALDQQHLDAGCGRIGCHRFPWTGNRHSCLSSSCRLEWSWLWSSVSLLRQSNLPSSLQPPVLGRLEGKYLQSPGLNSGDSVS